MRSRLTIAICALAALALLACGGEDGEPPGRSPDAVVEEPGPVHVHGLGVNPADGALFVATDTGLFRVARGASGGPSASPTATRTRWGSRSPGQTSSSA